MLQDYGDYPEKFYEFLVYPNYDWLGKISDDKEKVKEKEKIDNVINKI